MSADFKLESTPANLPRVGDRWIKRDLVCEVEEVTATEVGIHVTGPHPSYRRRIPLDEFDSLRKRTMAHGAIFKPAPDSIRENLCPSVVKP